MPPTGGRRFNALLATASINDAIEYYEVFKKLQAERQAADPEFVPLKIAAVFSPPAEGNPDVRQIQEDLPQEKEDNRHDPEAKKTALKAIIDDYNQQYGTNHDINNFDLYYQDIQQRIKDQQFPNRDLPRKGGEKIDITIVVDMLLTGFDAKYLNTLYVDKNLKHHGLIQAFSRTNRVLNATKPYGHILDFRQQQESVDAAIALFSGAQADRAREIWLVDKAPVVIDNFRKAVADLGEFMQSQGLEAKPDQVNNLMGDDARAQFIKRFKEVQRLQTQLDQYTDLTDEQREQIEQALPKDDLRAFRGVYLETARRLKDQQGTPGKDGEPANPEVAQLDFEFVLFASALIDYDYIMKLIAKYSGQDPKKLTISREQLIGLIQSDAKFLDEREEITDYVRSLKEGEGLDEAAIRAGYEQFKAERQAKEIEVLAQAHGLTTESLAAFVDTILQRMIFDGEQLTDLMEPLGLGWRERRERELALMADLVPAPEQAGSRPGHLGTQRLRAGRRAMTADKPSPFVPKLRFPEFRDAPDWEEVSLGTLLVRAPDYGVNAAAVPFSETLPTYIRITDINDDGQFASRARVSVDIDATDEQYLEDGDIVLARTGASVGKSYRYREEDGRLVYAGFLIRVRPNPQRLLSHFLAAYLSTWSYWDWVRLTSARSGQPGINATEYASIPLPLPPDRRTVAEQQKIADCLGSLDDLIAAEGRKLEALRQHKQGLLQQLFPQPRETQPILRFKEFRDAPDWEQAALGTLLDRPPGYGANAAAVPFSEDLPAYIRITDIDDDGRFVPAPRVSVDIEPGDDQFLQPGDIVLARTGASVGKSYRYRVEDGRLVFAGFLIRVRPNLDRLVPEFLSAYLSTWSYWDWVRLTSARSGQPGINGREYASMPLTYADLTLPACPNSARLPTASPFLTRALLHNGKGFGR